MNQRDDGQHLQLLAIFHFVVAGFSALFACFPIFHVLFGMVFFILGITQHLETALLMALVGLIFVLVGGTIMLFGWAFAILVTLTGRFLSIRKFYTFCLVMACVECIFTPFGTVLGVLTIIVLLRPSVKEMFMPQIPTTA